MRQTYRNWASMVEAMLNDLDGVVQGYLVSHTNIDNFPASWQREDFSYLSLLIIEYSFVTNLTVEQTLCYANGRTIKR